VFLYGYSILTVREPPWFKQSISILVAGSLIIQHFLHSVNTAGVVAFVKCCKCGEFAKCLSTQDCFRQFFSKLLFRDVLYPFQLAGQLLCKFISAWNIFRPVRRFGTIAEKVLIVSRKIFGILRRCEQSLFVYC